MTEHQCTTVPEVKKCTKAGTGCGSCVKVLGQLVNAELEASGIEVDKGLCGCFSQTREELYEIVLALRINTYQDLLDRYGRDGAKGGDGCHQVEEAATGRCHGGGWLRVEEKGDRLRPRGVAQSPRESPAGLLPS